MTLETRTSLKASLCPRVIRLKVFDHMKFTKYETCANYTGFIFCTFLAIVLVYPIQHSISLLVNVLVYAIHISMSVFVYMLVFAMYYI